MITPQSIKENAEINAYITRADKTLVALGYTEHSFAHVTRVAQYAADILTDTGRDKRTAELAWIAGYLHDIGNVVNRVGHAQSGALMAFSLLQNTGLDPVEIAAIVTAIGHHDEGTAFPVNKIAAALILADKTDVRRSRVRNANQLAFDIHDRVNYAVTSSKMVPDYANKSICLTLEIDTAISPVMDYFEIFIDRMKLCRKASAKLGLEFKLKINGLEFL